MPAPENFCSPREKRPMLRDLSISPLCEPCEQWKGLIQIQQPPEVPVVRQRLNDRLRSTVNGTVGFNQLHGGLESRTWNFGKTYRDLRVLRWQIIEPLARGALPAVYPQGAKAAIAVINH